MNYFTINFIPYIDNPDEQLNRLIYFPLVLEITKFLVFLVCKFTAL